MACNDHTTCIAHRPRFNMMTLVNFLILSLVASTQQHFHCTRASQFFTIQSQQITFALFFPCHVLHHSNDIKVSLSFPCTYTQEQLLPFSSVLLLLLERVFYLFSLLFTGQTTSSIENQGSIVPWDELDTLQAYDYSSSSVH